MIYLLKIEMLRTSHGVVPRNSGGAQLNPSTPPWIDINAPSNVIANIIILFEERASDCYDILVIVMPLVKTVIYEF